MSPVSVAWMSLHQLTPMVWSCVLTDQLRKEKITWAQVTDGLMWCVVLDKNILWLHYSSSGVVLKDNGKGNFSQMAKLQENTFVHSLYMEEIAWEVDMRGSLGRTQWLGFVQEKAYYKWDWKTKENEICGGGMWMDGLTGMGTNRAWRSLCLRISHPRGGSQQSHEQDDCKFASWLYLLGADTLRPLAEMKAMHEPDSMTPYYQNRSRYFYYWMPYMPAAEARQLLCIRWLHWGSSTAEGQQLVLL